MSLNRIAKIAGVIITVIGTLSLVPFVAWTHTTPKHPRISLATDWSHKHMIYSRPGREDVRRKLEHEFRFLQQDRRRHRIASRRKIADTLRADWSVNLGADATVGALNYPAKFSFDVTEGSCGGDYVAFNTSAAGTSSQASVIAFSQLYTACGAPPSVSWAYNTSFAAVLSGIVSTSIVLSEDGSQLAFIDSPASGSASLVILKWAQGEGSSAASAVAPDQVFATTSYNGSNATNFSTCKSSAGSCMLAWNFSGGASDATSSPFYDYDADVLYVGDASGGVHKFTGVFRGVPAEVTTNWPVTLQSGSDQVASVVYDSVSGEVFAADNDGFLYSINCTQSSVSVPCSSSAPAPATSVIQSAQLAHDPPLGPGFVDGPIVDGAAGMIYLFAGRSNLGLGLPGVFQIPIGFAAGATGIDTPIGGNGGFRALYAGDFDNDYYNSEPGITGQLPSGNLYVCGDAAFSGKLLQIPIVSGVMGGVHLLPGTLATGAIGGNCSSVTEFFNPNGAGGPEDEIFFSITDTSAQNYSEVANTNNCVGGGCVMSMVVSSWQPGTSYALNQHILDSNLHEQIVVSAGTSSGAGPAWPASAGSLTADGTVQWEDQGAAANYNSWGNQQPSTPGFIILDNNSHIQLAQNNTCTTGGTLPDWTESLGAVTVDGTCQWTNLGPAGMAGFGVTGGTSGIVIDNLLPGIGTGSLPGASQIYFSILGSQACKTGGTGSCAIQVSQSALR